MVTKQQTILAVGTLTAIVIFYMFAFPKPKGCGCESRRVTILNKLGIG